MQFALFIVAVGVLSLAVAKYIASQVKKAESGNEKMNEIGNAIHEGSMAFLMREYKAMAVFMVVMAIIIFLFLDHPKTESINEAPWTALAFILGSSISILAGFIGMKIATKANVKTANAAQKSLSKAFDIAFKSCSVLGFSLVGLAILGISLSYILLKFMGFPVGTIMEILTGFALGGSSIALFARVGGGIYTKAAYVGADLVGKVEKGIPEDDPRNPAVIADNVGDNVGDCAGMAADLFETYAVTAIAAMLLAALPATFSVYGMNGIYFPLLLGAVAILASIIGTFFVRNATPKTIMDEIYKAE